MLIVNHIDPHLTLSLFQTCYVQIPILVPPTYTASTYPAHNVLPYTNHSCSFGVRKTSNINTSHRPACFKRHSSRIRRLWVFGSRVHGTFRRASIV